MRINRHFLNQVFLEHNLSLHEEEKYSFSKNIINLKKLDIIKKEKLKENLNSLFKNIEKTENGNKSVFLFSSKKEDHTNGSLLIQNGDFFLSIEINAVYRPHIIFFDNNLEIIYTKHSFYSYQPVHWGLETKYFFYSCKKISLLINTYKDQPCYVRRSFGKNNFNFTFHGKEKPSRMSVHENTIEVEYKNSIYSNIVFDKSFNLKEIILSDAYYNKIKEFHSNKKIQCSSFDDFTEKLESAFLLINLQYDKDPYFISKEVFEKQVNYLKKSFNNQCLLDSDTACFDLINDMYSKFDIFNDRARNIFESHTFKMTYGFDNLWLSYSEQLKVFSYLLLNQEINENNIIFFNLELIESIKKMHLLYEKKML